MNQEGLRQFIENVWQKSIIDRLQAYVRIPNKSPAFDPEWERHGYMDQAIELMAAWCRTQPVAGMRVEVRRLPGITPLLLIDVPGELPDCVLLYGHLDKQPEFTGWLPGLGPWEPVIRDGKLYGRGGADDGYAVFSSLTAIAALKAQKIPLPRCVLMIEATEESGSIHLPAHLDALGSGIGDPSLVICLDAECGNYDQLWTTTSLRGNLVGKLTVRVLTEGAHSGLASGIAATPFRLLAQLIARIEDPASGELKLEELHADIPKDRRAQIGAAASVLGGQILDKIPFARGVGPVTADAAELLINNTWRPTLAVTGADGLPPLSAAGNVLLPVISLKVSLRLPPTVEPERAARAVKAALEMRTRLKKLNEAFIARGLPELRTGIGLHSGQVVAGNMGHAERMEYTVIGDTVNLASRLEGMTKELQCDVILSEDLFAQVEAHVITEPLRRIKVKGRDQDVMVYRLVGLKSDVPSS